MFSVQHGLLFLYKPHAAKLSMQVHLSIQSYELLAKYK